MKIIKKAAALSLVILLAAGCGANNNTASRQMSAPMAAPVPETKESMRDEFYGSYNTGTGEMAEEGVASYDTGVVASTSQEAYVSGEAYTPSSPLMFIKTANIYLESHSFDEDLTRIRGITSEAGGYFENSNMYTHNTGKIQSKRYNATIRVPVEVYDSVKLQIEGIGVLVSASESSDEVSGAYHDIESRMKTKKTEEERLLQLIERAGELDQLIILERRLGEVRTDIELYQMQMNNLQARASYSTINIDMTEREQSDVQTFDDSFGGRIKKGFDDSVRGTAAFFENIIIFLAYAVIPAVVIAVPVLAAFFIARIFKKKSKRLYNTNKNHRRYNDDEKDD